MTRGEYEDAVEFMARVGVVCPHPSDLVRGSVVGSAVVTAIVSEYDSPWFFGPKGLVVRDAEELVAPIPAVGKLGFFEWRPSGGKPDTPTPWMTKWGRVDVSSSALPLDADLFDGGRAA